MSKDYISDVYYERKLSSRSRKQLKERVHWIIENVAGKKILDVGCSQGLISLLLAEKGYHVLGIDILEDSVRDANLALEQYPEQVRNNMKFICNNFLEYDFVSEKFDTVIIGQVLEHLQPEIGTKFIKKAYELLDPKGSLIVTVPFGRLDHDDHHVTFYVEDILDMVSDDFIVEFADIVSKRTCLICKKSANEEQSKSIEAEAIASLYLKGLKQIENDNIDDVIRLRRENNAKKEKLDRSKEINHNLTKKIEENKIQLSKYISKYEETTEGLQNLQFELNAVNKKLKAIDMSYRNSLLIQRILKRVAFFNGKTLDAMTRENENYKKQLNQALSMDLQKRNESFGKSVKKILSYYKNYFLRPKYIAMVTESYKYHVTSENKNIFKEIRELYKENNIEAILERYERNLTKDNTWNAVLSTFCASVVKTRYKDYYIDFALKALTYKNSNFLAIKMSKNLFKTGDLTNTKKFLTYFEKSNNLSGKDYYWLQLTKGWMALEDYLELSYHPKKCTHEVSNTAVMLCLHNSLPHNSGGYATRSHGIASGLFEKGITPYVYTRMGYPWDRPENRHKAMEAFKEIDKIDKIKYRRIYSKGFGVGTAPINEYISYSSKFISNRGTMHNVSLVHAASNFYTGLPAMIGAKQMGVPFIYEVRGLWEITRGSREKGWSESEMFDLHARLEALVAKKADAVITLTESLRDVLIERGVDAEKIYIVPNSVDASKFLPKDRNMKLAAKYGITNEIVVGYLGSFAQYEGLDTLVDVFTDLIKDGHNIKLMLVGDGAELGKIKSKVKKNNIESHVVFTGRVPHEEIPEYYSIIDIAPFPRKPQPVCEIVSPLKPFEAMAMSKAVIVSSVAAMAEFIDGKNGMVFDKNDKNDLKAKIELLINDKYAISEFGKYAREWVKKNRSWDSAVERLTEIYEHVQNKHVTECANNYSMADVADEINVGNITSTLKMLTLINEKHNGKEKKIERYAKMLEFLNSAEKYDKPSDGRLGNPQKSLMVLHNSMPYDNAGYAVRSHTILKGLNSLGIEATAMTRLGYPKDINRHKDKVVKEIDVVDGIVYEHSCHTTELYKNGCDFDYVEKYADEIIKRVEKHDAGILHACSNYYNALAANLAAKKTGRCSVYELRGLWYLTDVSKEARMDGSELFRYHEKMERKALNEANHIITISNALKDYVINMGIDEAKISVVQNAVDTSIFQPKQRNLELKKSLGLSHNTFVVGFLGSITVYEGINHIINAVSDMVASGKDIAMIIVGDGAHVEKLKALASIKGEAKIIFTGRVSFEQVRDYYSIFDVCPFPRLDDAVCKVVPPLKIFEAMAMKVPVVISDLLALTEIIENGKTGLSVESNNSDALREAIETLYENRSLGAKYASKAYERIVTDWNWSENIKKYSHIYNKLLK